MNAFEDNEQQLRSTRIAIVGTGNVGSTYAYALLLSGLASEIVLIDANRAKAEGEAMDLNHAVTFAYPTRVWAGDYSDCADAAITVIAAGVSQRPGETRLDTISRNGEIWKQIIPEIVRYCATGILLIATNPVDVLTYAAWKISGLSAKRVIGSGTILDTSRFRYLLSQYFGVDARSVHAHIIGEHGDSEVPVWSLANIAGMRLEDFSRIQSTVLSVSSLIDGPYGLHDVCLSLPTIVNRHGIKHVLELDLSQDELQKLRHSADVLKGTFAKLAL